MSGVASGGAADTRRTSATKLTGLLVATAVVSAVAGLLYGYDTGIISGALLQISDEFGIEHGTEQVIAASILAGAVLGALACSRLSEAHGRKRTILLIAAIFTVGAIASSLAPTPWLLSLGRLVLGFAVGGGTQVVPMYVAELAPADRRGRLVLFSRSRSAWASSSPRSSVRRRRCPGASRSAARPSPPP